MNMHATPATLRPALLVGFLASMCASPPALAQTRPNILFLFTDDHASHAISAYGSKINRTPNLDRLAAEGMRFDNAFCTNSICAPSRAVILTGKHSHLNGVISNRERFDGSQEHVAKILRRHGYTTAVIGKWHLKSAPTGFDFWEVLIGQGPYYNPPMRTPEGVRDHIGYTTEVITDLGLKWLAEERDASKPFFLMLQHKAPHREWAPGPAQLHLYDDVTIPEPATLFDDYEGRTSAARTQEMSIAEHFSDRDLKLVPPDNLTGEQLAAWNAAYGPKNAAFERAGLEGKELVRWKYQRYIKDYLRCIASVDDNIGRVLDYLKESGLERNTVVFYSSDQGFFLGDHGWYDKRWMYEESLRMPLLARWPGTIAPGSVDRHLVQNLDFAETFLDLAGVEIPAAMQGRSLVPLLRGEDPADWRRSIYYHYWEFPAVHSVRRHYGVRTDRYKLIHYYLLGEWELFDLVRDPDELRSVYADPAYVPQVAHLKTELARLQKHYGDTEPHIALSEIGQRELRAVARRVTLEQVLALERADALARSDLDPAAKPITAGAHCRPTAGDGVIIAQGGAALGYSLYLSDGKPHFAVRNEGELRQVVAEHAVTPGEAVHLAGVLDAEGVLRLYVDGAEAARGQGFLLARKPADALTVGADSGSPVAEYTPPLAFEGTITDLRVYWGALEPGALREWAREEPR